MPRCLLAVCFDEEEQSVYMGDKCGNVYKYKVAFSYILNINKCLNGSKFYNHPVFTFVLRPKAERLATVMLG